MILGDRGGLAGRNTTDAGPATGRLRLICGQCKSGQDFSQEKPSAQLWIDQHRALAVPSDSSFRCMIAFEDRSCIHVTLLGSAVLAKKFIQLSQFPQDNFMVVFSPSITGNLASGGLRC